ncbi:MAG: hypothetical protein Q7U23_14745 [Methylococcales bacterium]|nr:hypothetical protein [Methylococcales bacterium]
MTVTATTGGSAIASNTAPSCSAAGWTALTNPKIAENNAGEISLGDIVLTAPAGFEFNTAAAVTILLSGNGTNTRNINNITNGASVPITSINATQITFTVTKISTRPNRLTWQGIQVRPTASSPLASGNITETGTSSITGINASTNLGTLTEVASTPVCVVTAPAATTNAATAITTSSAILNGIVSSNGATTTPISFEYGLTTAYGSTVAASPSSLAAGVSNNAVSASITGLTCNLGYHFRVKAINSAGTAYGNDMSFTAASCPTPTITSISPISKNMGSAGFTLTLNGTNFVAISQVQLDGSNRATTYVSATQLTAIIPASDLNNATTYAVTVVNSAIASNALSFSVIPQLPPLPAQCFSDNFSNLSVTDWNVTGSYTPNVVSNRLRLTSANTNLKSMAQLQRWFPAANNTVVLTFDYYAYGGSGADGVAVVLSDANTTPAPGGYGGSLGYAQYTGPISGFNGGWLGIGLDEWGNFPNNNESRTGYPTGWTPPVGANTASGFYANSVAVRSSGSGNTGYALLANTGTVSPALWVNAMSMPTAHRYRITIDHSNSVNGWVTVQRDTTGTGSSFTTLVPTFDVKAANSGQAAVPNNFYLSLTASTGGSTNIHEIDNLQVCATTQLPVGGGLHHLEITGNSNGPTCQPTSLTIKACANAACAGYTSTAVSGTLTASNTVNWDPNGTGATADFTIPAGSISITKPMLVSTVGVTTFGINSAVISPAATNTTTCNLGGTNSCNFTGTATGLSVTVPNHISCANQAVTLTGCGSTFANMGRNIKLYTTYLNPSSGTQPATATFLNNSGTTSTVTLATSATGTALTNLKFNGSATASNLTISYPDVGQLQLNASYTGSSATGDNGLNMNGSSTFIVAPASFSVSNISPAPLIAGKDFSATVTAKNQCAVPNTTPNFGLEASPEGVTLSHTKYQPTGVGAVNGLFSGTVGSFSNGVATSNNLNWSEVGTIDLNATLSSGNYLGSNVTAASGNTGSTGAVGAFIPDHFNTTVTQGCSAGGFTYSGQAFTATVTALNGLAVPTTTVNYDGSANTSPHFAKTVILSEANGVAGSLAPTNVAATAFTAGVASPSPAFTFTNNPTNQTTIKLRAVDTGNVSSATGTEGTALIRSGRIQLANAYGSELLDLAMPLTAQYWNGSAWVTHSDDNCTTGINLSLTDPNNTDGLIPAESCVFDNGAGSGLSGLGCSVVGGGSLQYKEPPLNGNFNLNFKATGVGNAGYLDVIATIPTYLQFNWRGLGNANPTARATFGIYKGNDKIIYFRELY